MTKTYNKPIKRILVVGLSALLFACGTTSNTTSVKPKVAAQVVTLQADIAVNALEQIKVSFQGNNDISARNTALVDLANNYQAQGDCLSATIILQHINDSIVIDSTRSKANVIKAECELSKISVTAALKNDHPLLALIDTWLSETSSLPNDNQWQRRVLRARVRTRELKHDYVGALSLVFNSSYSQSFLTNSHDNSRIWQWFSLSSKDQQKAMVRQFRELHDYNALLQITEDQSLNDTQRQRNIKQWLAQYPDSVLSKIIPLQISEYLALENNHGGRTAVLLPLSGRLANQGEAIKQGILTAYLDQSRRQNASPQAAIEFIDTGSLSELNAAINIDLLTEFDTIIGPLLKSHLEQLAGYITPKQKVILLNQNENAVLFKDNLHAYFALSPEQEARQLVTLMRTQNIRNPILVEDGSNISSRMLKAFNDTWEHPEFAHTLADEKQANSEAAKYNKVQSIVYDDNKSMRIGITAALDVLQSQRRIKQLNNIIPETVHSVTRNRRDVDAFVVFARPDDVELLNPIIESSISLFTEEQVPVFATSYSYDHKQNKNTQRDLRNLVFIDMPWLLPSGRKGILSEEVDKLFNKPSSAFLRLFAFGYDALSVSDNLAQLSTFTHMSINGLSGVLDIHNNQEVTRTLPTLSITDASTLVSGRN